jgi:hypothetical protein
VANLKSQYSRIQNRQTTFSDPVKHVISVLAVTFAILLVLASGCADVKATQKVGDFGTAFGASSDEQKAIDWFKTTYGDPLTNNDQPAKFVEPLITTSLSSNNMPVDKVTTFPVTGGSVYFFVIYDNFKKGDPITVSWVYMENGREVTKVEKQAGGDFGRFIVEFQKPDSGWGKGKQKITVSSGRTSAEVTFTIGDALQTIALPYNPGGVAAAETTVAKPVTTLGRLTRTPGGVISSTTTAALTTTSAPVADIKTDVNNCGKIGNVCPGVTNAKTHCGGGTCWYTCISPWDHDTGHVDAPVDPKVGCTLNTNIDPKNCGGFDIACKGSEVCQDGNCVSTCTAKPGANIKSCNSGCADLKTDVNNCGSCGHSCLQTAPANVFVQCVNSQCTPSSFSNGGTCQAGWADCDGKFLTTGCEKSVTTDNQNCGGCNKACPTLTHCVSAGRCCDDATGALCCNQGDECKAMVIGLIVAPAVVPGAIPPL